MMHLKIVTVDRVLVDEPHAERLFTKSEVGEFEILPNHAPLIVLTRPATTRYAVGGQERILFTARGVLRVLSDEVLFIADAAERKEDIDLSRALRAKKDALEALQGASKTRAAELKEDLARALARIETVQGAQKK
ncbi:ATP synthase epsilon chain [Clostridiaceae bacterium JG1575]|nr:ATP synthase epsilon chain [Clostridiaceae bacterium JG1575]